MVEMKIYEHSFGTGSCLVSSWRWRKWLMDVKVNLSWIWKSRTWVMQ